MQKVLRKSLMVTALLVALSACGGGGSDTPTSGGGSKPNAAPTLTVGKSSVVIESGQSATVQVTASDDNSTPNVAVGTVSAGINAALVNDVLTITGTADKATVSGTVTLIATEGASTQLTSTQQINVTVYPKVELFALVSGAQRVSSLSVSYGKPLTFNVVDANNEPLPFSQVGVKDGAVAKASHSQNQVTLTALKSGQTELQISGTLASGQQYVKTLAVTSLGNQMPTLAVSPTSISIQANNSAQLGLTITDADGSAFTSGELSAKSADNSIATATIQNGALVVTGVSTGSAQVTVSLIDGEHTVTANVAVTVTQETLPTVVLNDNEIIEIEEDSTLTFPVAITGPRASEYKATVEVKSVTGKLSDLSYSVENNVLTIKSGRITSTGAPGRVAYTVTATATNGKNVIKSLTTGLDLIAKTNGVAIFEFPNKFGTNIMIARNGTSTVKITVNDDNAKQVTLFTPEPWFNNSAAGTYTSSYDDETRTLTLTLTGFERNERFGMYLSYKDGNLGGKFSFTFRTYELSPADQEVIGIRNQAIAKVEAARAYQWIAKMYAEHLENIGAVDGQYVDELNDQMRVDDTAYGKYTSAEYYINQALEQVYSNEFNTAQASVEGIRMTLDGLVSDAMTLNREGMVSINELADKSNGRFPRLNFETNVQSVSALQYSKFFGNRTYGDYTNGQWQYAPAYQFLSAIDAKVNEATQKRVK